MKLEKETFRWMCDNHTANEVHEKYRYIQRRHGNANLVVDSYKYRNSYIEWKICC